MPRIPVQVRASQPGTSGLPWPSGGPAFVYTSASWRGTKWFGPFLVDTGAARTILGTVPTMELMRRDYGLIDFERDPSRVSMGGIGGTLRCVVREIDFSFPTEEGDPFHLTAPILIPEIADASLAGMPNRLPSLLGRDLLGAGALTLAYRLPTELHFSNMPTGVSL